MSRRFHISNLIARKKFPWQIKIFSSFIIRKDIIFISCRIFNTVSCRNIPLWSNLEAVTMGAWSMVVDIDGMGRQIWARNCWVDGRTPKIGFSCLKDWFRHSTWILQVSWGLFQTVNLWKRFCTTYSGCFYTFLTLTTLTLATLVSRGSKQSSIILKARK